MRQFGPAVRKYFTLFEGAEAGHYTLPAPITDLVATWDRLAAYRDGLAEPTAVGARLRLEIRTAAATDGEYPDGTEWLAADDNIRRYTELRAASRQVLLEVEHDLDMTIRRNAAPLITDHLRPTLDALIVKARKAAEDLGDYQCDSMALLSAPAKARTARLTMATLADQYTAIRKAQRMASDLLPSSVADSSGYMVEMTNLRSDIWPNPQYPAPWPAEPVERLRWLMVNGANLTCLTPAERDEIAGDHARQSGPAFQFTALPTANR
jgi:hypothetical protein